MDSNHRPHAYQACALTSWAIGPLFFGAGEGNRTLIISLEGWGFTTKLHPQKKMVAQDGIEPPTQGFSVLCSTDWATEPRIWFLLSYLLILNPIILIKMAVPTGIEPAISCVTGRHVNRYTTGPFGCGGRIWTCDLRVMSPTSCHCSTPR